MTREVINSVGIDVGTSTTELVFSRLTIENLAGPASVPRISITEKQIAYRSAVHTTPLLRPDLIDAAALRRIVLAEYTRAGIRPDQVRTGAAIITGETARAVNADQVLAALSELAGDFVVATAGPELESVLAARGAGIDRYSEHSGGVIANLDIGGGTTNIAAYRRGRLLGTCCLDIGGRLVRIAPSGSGNPAVGLVTTPIAELARANGIQLSAGEDADPGKLLAVARLMARQLAMALRLVPQDDCHARLYTNTGHRLPASIVPTEISFSGGVADLIRPGPVADPFRYGDLGVLLGQAIAEDSAFARLDWHRGAETIGATVVGAGVHTTEISGSTIEYAAALLPLRNVPIIRIPPDAETEPAKLASEISSQLAILHPESAAATVAIAFSGRHATTFARVQAYARAIAQAAEPVLAGPNPLIIVLEKDCGKVLGQSLAALRGRRDDVVCIDGVQTTSGDYIDIGQPVGAGRAVPVVLKTLVFNDQHRNNRRSDEAQYQPEWGDVPVP